MSVRATLALLLAACGADVVVEPAGGTGGAGGATTQGGAPTQGGGTPMPGGGAPGGGGGGAGSEPMTGGAGGVGGAPFPACEALVETGAPVAMPDVKSGLVLSGSIGRVGDAVGAVVRVHPGSEWRSTLIDAFGAWPPSFSEPVIHGTASTAFRWSLRDDGAFRFRDDSSYPPIGWRVGRVGVPGLLHPVDGVPLFEPSPSETVWWSTGPELLEFASVEAEVALGTYPPLASWNHHTVGSDGLGRAVVFTPDGLAALEGGALTPLGPKPSLVEWRSFLLPHPEGVWIVGPTEDNLLEITSLVDGVLSGSYRPFGDAPIDSGVGGQRFAAASWVDGTIALVTQPSQRPFAQVAVTDGVASTTTLDVAPGFLAPVTLATDPSNHLVVGYVDAFEPSYRLRRFGCVGAE